MACQARSPAKRSSMYTSAASRTTMDLGESLVTTAVRAVKEETGVDCEVTGLVGVYTDPKHIILYPSDGEARQEFSVLFTARPIGGEPPPSSESREVVWVSREEILGLHMDRSMRMRVQHYLDALPLSIPTTDGQSHEAEFIGLVPSGQTITRPAPKEWVKSYFSPEPVEIEFLDSSGRHWTPRRARHPHGRLGAASL